MDPFDFLEHDHRHVEDLIRQIIASHDAATRRELLDHLARELVVHTALEETLVYPAMQAHPELAPLVKDALAEHAVVDSLAAELLGLPELDTADVTQRVEHLQDVLAHHIHDEEDESFPKARELLSADQLQQLGEQMRTRKDELVREHRIRE